MSTVAEIEEAIEGLPPEQVREIAAWLESHKEKLLGTPPGGFPLFGILEGRITYHEGWDEPLEDFAPYTK
jgi:hypothetical protein